MAQTYEGCDSSQQAAAPSDNAPVAAEAQNLLSQDRSTFLNTTFDTTKNECAVKAGLVPDLQFDFGTGDHSTTLASLNVNGAGTEAKVENMAAGQRSYDGPNGQKITEDPNTGQRTTQYPDGTKVIESPQRRVTIRPDGTRVEHNRATGETITRVPPSVDGQGQGYVIWSRPGMPDQVLPHGALSHPPGSRPDRAERGMWHNRVPGGRDGVIPPRRGQDI